MSGLVSEPAIVDSALVSGDKMTPIQMENCFIVSFLGVINLTHPHFPQCLQRFSHK